MMLYPKINGVFKRDHDTNKFTDEFAMPEFEDLLDVEWRGTEKVDGTNVRIYIDQNKQTVRGRTDNAQMPPRLLEYINRLDLRKYEGLELFGEGYGGKIQHGTGYSDEEQFIMFDAVISDTKRWLTRDELSIIQVRQVEEYQPRTLVEWIEDFREGDFPKSDLRDGYAEGVVLVPTNNYLDKYGHRIITKLKVKDFQ